MERLQSWFWEFVQPIPFGVTFSKALSSPDNYENGIWWRLARLMRETGEKETFWAVSTAWSSCVYINTYKFARFDLLICDEEDRFLRHIFEKEYRFLRPIFVDLRLIRTIDFWRPILDEKDRFWNRFLKRKADLFFAKGQKGWRIKESNVKKQN